MAVEHTIFRGGIGEGILTDVGEVIPDLVKQSVTVVDTVIEPDTMTDLLGHWRCPIRYVGMILPNTLVFYLGDQGGSLFEPRKSAYQCIHLITPTRLFLMFTFKSGRDWNWIKGKWK